MARLTEDLHQALTPPVLQSLFKKSVFTCLGFVRANNDLLSKAADLHYTEILEIKDAIQAKFSSKVRFGHKFYQEIINHCAIIPTGIESLDKLLDSGLMTGNIYEFCGFAGSGKTQLCMTVAVNICISSVDHQVLYVDTKNDISALRLSDIVENKKREDIGETLQRIKICQTRTIYDLLQELHLLERRLHNSKEKYLGFKVIIIDSLSVLCTHFQSASEGLSLLNNLASLLRYIASEYHLVIVLSNLARSWMPEEGEGEEEEQEGPQQVQMPALGKYWAHVPNVRVMVKKQGELDECFLIVLKSANQPVGKSVKVKLGNDGVT